MLAILKKVDAALFSTPAIIARTNHKIPFGFAQGRLFDKLRITESLGSGSSSSARKIWVSRLRRIDLVSSYFSW